MCICVCFLVKVNASKEFFWFKCVVITWSAWDCQKREKWSNSCGLFEWFEVCRTLLEFCPGLIPWPRPSSVLSTCRADRGLSDWSSRYGMITSYYHLLIFLIERNNWVTSLVNTEPLLDVVNKLITISSSQPHLTCPHPVYACYLRGWMEGNRKSEDPQRLGTMEGPLHLFRETAGGGVPRTRLDVRCPVMFIVDVSV